MINIRDQYLDAVYPTVVIENYLEVDLNQEGHRKGLERNYSKKLDMVIDYNKKIINTNEDVNSRLKKDIPELEYRINTIVEKLRGAILVERNTTSTIYSTIIPITRQYTDNERTTATVKDNVIFGISDTKIDYEDITVLPINNIVFKNLNIKKLNKNVLKDLTISNLTHNTLPFEFTINLTNVVSSSSALILDLKDFAIIEIYKDNTLFKEKELSNYFSIPIDIDTTTVTIRSYPTMHKSTDLNINILGVTELIYQEATTFESKDIAISETLSNLVLDTCDNSSDNNIKIDYFISINNKEYEAINTTHSFKDKNNIIQSVISLSKDSELSLLPLQGIKKSEGDIQYTLPDSVQNNVNFEIDVYLPNINKLKKESLHLLIKEDIYLHKSLIIGSNTTEKAIYLDNKLIDEDLFLVPKGIRELIIIEGSENLSGNYNYNYLEVVVGSDNIYSSKIKKSILKRSDYKYISLTSLDLIDAFGDTNIRNIFIKNIKKEVYVNTLKLKAILSSKDKKTVPYISRFLIRGI